MKKLFTNRYLLFILLLALFTRIFISFGTGLPWITVDSVNYINQAKALLNGGYEYYFPNGYPLIIAFFTLLSPLIPLKLGLILFNIFISVLGVILIYLISEEYFGEGTIYPLLAAVIAAFYPNQLNYVRFILTEVSAAFFLILSLYLFVKNSKKMSGLFIGFASAIRTTLIPVSLLFTIYLFAKKKIRVGVLFLIFFLVPLLAFHIYGFLQTGSFTLFIDVPKIFYISLGLGKIPPDFTSGLKEYLNYFIENPFGFIYDRIVSLWDLWGFLPASNEGLRGNIFFRLLVAFRFPLLIFALYGFVKSRKSYLTVFLIIPAIVITCIHALIITSVHESYIADQRYIFPAEPFLIVLSVIGLENLYNKFFNRQGKSFVQQL